MCLLESDWSKYKQTFNSGKTEGKSSFVLIEGLFVANNTSSTSYYKAVIKTKQMSKN